MKKLTIILMVFCLSIILVAQPTKTGYLKTVLGHGQTIKVECPECPPKAIVTKPVVKPTGTVYKKNLTIKKAVPTPEARDTLIINNNININIPVINENINKNLPPTTQPLVRNESALSLQSNLLYVNYRHRGYDKIIAGLGFQLAGAGLIVCAHIPKYKSVTVVETHKLEYKYKTYELQKVSASEKCCPQWKLIEQDKTGILTLTDTDKRLVAVSRNKTAYYIGAGVLGIAGLVLEISGITDINKSEFYVTGMGLGYQHNF